MTPNTRVLSFADARPVTTGNVSSEASQLLIGPSPATAQLWEQLRRVAPHFRTALLTGESGTGAESVARVLHDLSPVAARPFLVLPAPEAEARFKSRTHLFTPDEGVLYLPEIDRLSTAAQLGLERHLRHRSSLTGSPSARIVVYARRGLRTLTSTGTFSAELAATLSAVRIAVPSLRERPEDIPLLASHILQRLARARSTECPTLSTSLLDAARLNPWPGNLDQLSAALRWMLDRINAPEFTAADLEAALGNVQHVVAPELPKTRLVPLDQVVQEHIRNVLLACNGNKLRAAEVLRISRSTLYRMLDNQPTGTYAPQESLSHMSIAS